MTNAFHVDRPLLRGANADLNMTFAMAMVFFALWIVWALQENGVGGFILHIFGPKGDSKGILKILMIVVFFMVGWLEIVSILFRPISLSFRLYGNVYAGENMLEAMAHMVPALSWLIPIPFYFMELLVGMVQALVFMLVDRGLHSSHRAPRAGARRAPLNNFRRPPRIPRKALKQTNQREKYDITTTGRDERKHSRRPRGPRRGDRRRT